MNYQTQELFLQAFGLSVQKYYSPEVSNQKSDDPNGLYTGLEIVSDINEAKEISSLGTPIVFPIYFLAGEYKEYDFDGSIKKVKKENFRLPITSIIEIKRDKEIITTKMNGASVSAKERYIFDDYHINIKGFFLLDQSQPQGHFTALKQEAEVIRWESLVSSIAVNCIIFDIHKIRNIVIKSIEISPIRGKPYIRSFNISALSDNNFNLKLP